MPKGQPPGPNFAIEGSPARPFSILQDAVTGERYRVRIHQKSDSEPQVTVEKDQEAPLVPVDASIAEAPYVLNSGTEALSESKTECDPGLNQLVFEVFNTNHDPQGKIDGGTINITLNGVPDNAWQDGVSTTDNLNKCLVQYLPVGATEWQTATQGTYPPDPTWPQWSIPLSAENSLPHFESDKAAKKFQIKVCNLHTDLVSGLTEAMANLEFVDCRDAAGNDYGETWFNLQLIKSPMITKGAHVGVGNLQALAPLHVGSPTRSTHFPAIPALLISRDVQDATDQKPHLMLHNENIEGGTGGSIVFTGRGTTKDENHIGASIFGQLDHQPEEVAGTLSFWTGTSGKEDSAGVQQRMNILPNGNVGIVTATPQAPLHVGAESEADWAQVDAGTVMIHKNIEEQHGHPHLRLHNENIVPSTSLDFSSLPTNSNQPQSGAVIRCLLTRTSETVNGILKFATADSDGLNDWLTIDIAGNTTLDGPAVMNETLQVVKTADLKGAVAAGSTLSVADLLTASGGINAQGPINLGTGSSPILAMIMGFAQDGNTRGEWTSNIGTDHNGEECWIIQYKNSDPWNRNDSYSLAVITLFHDKDYYNTFSTATFGPGNTPESGANSDYSDYGFYAYAKTSHGGLTTESEFSFIAACIQLTS